MGDKLVQVLLGGIPVPDDVPLPNAPVLCATLRRNVFAPVADGTPPAQVTDGAALGASKVTLTGIVPSPAGMANVGR